MGRIVAFVYGVVCYLVFFGTFLYAIGFTGNVFVRKGIDTGEAGPMGEAVLINLLLLTLFAVQHSVMARPAFKRVWTKIVPKSVERSTYVLLASLILCLMYWQWRAVTDPVWSVAQPGVRTALWALFGIGWATVLLSTVMIGHLELFGVTQVWNHLRSHEPAPPKFKAPVLYKLVRHPIMVGFIIAFWAIPDMTMGHLLFAGVTTAYILVAIQLEERDLTALLGDDYVQYRKRVPSLIPFTKFGGGSESGPPADS